MVSPIFAVIISINFDDSLVCAIIIRGGILYEPPKACAALDEEKFSNEMLFACTAGTQSPHTTIASGVASLGYRIFMVFPLCTV